MNLFLIINITADNSLVGSFYYMECLQIYAQIYVLQIAENLLRVLDFLGNF